MPGPLGLERRLLPPAGVERVGAPGHKAAPRPDPGKARRDTLDGVKRLPVPHRSIYVGEITKPLPVLLQPGTPVMSAEAERS